MRTVAGAIKATVAVYLWVVEAVADLLWRAPEVVDGALGIVRDVTGRNQDVVDGNALAAVRQVQCMVEHGARVVVGEAVQVPVGVAAEHDRRFLGGRDGHHLGVPGQLSHGVGDVRDHLAGEAFLAVRINDGEGDAVVGVRHDLELPPVPTVEAPVKGVNPLGVCLGGVLVGCDVENLSVELKRAVLDPVGVAAGHAAEMRMHFVYRVVAGIVIAHDNVPLDAALILDEQVGDRRPVGDEGGSDSLAIDPVLSIRVWTKHGCARRNLGHGSKDEPR